MTALVTGALPVDLPRSGTCNVAMICLRDEGRKCEYGKALERPRLLFVVRFRQGEA